MRIQVVILSLFAMLWGVAALAIENMRGPILALPVAVTAALLLAGWKILPPTTRSRDELARKKRMVRIWSFIEGVLMVGAVLTLGKLHAQAYIPAALAIIVGLHFLPLARGIPERLFYATAVAMIGAGIVGPLLAPGHLVMLVPAVGGAIILWLSAVGIILGGENRTARQ